MKTKFHLRTPFENNINRKIEKYYFESKSPWRRGKFRDKGKALGIPNVVTPKKKYLRKESNFSHPLYVRPKRRDPDVFSYRPSPQLKKLKDILDFYRNLRKA